MKLTDEQLRKLADRLEGTPDSIETGIEAIGLDSDAIDICIIEEKIGDLNLERCCDCDWWCEAGELVDEDGEVVPCESCRG